MFIKTTGVACGVLFVAGLGCSNHLILEDNILFQQFKSRNQALSNVSQSEFIEHLTFRTAKGHWLAPHHFDDPVETDVFQSPQRFSYPEWALGDPELNSVEGTSTERAYAEFKLSPPSKPIIVAVIDSGADVLHEDLKEIIWKNEAELHGIPGEDNDQNGYVGDTLGWNFVGNQNGTNVKVSSLEVTRVYSSLLKKQQLGTLTPSEEIELQEVKAEYESLKQPYQENFDELQKSLNELEAAILILKEKGGLQEETLEAIRALHSEDLLVLEAKQLALKYYENDTTLRALRKMVKWARAPLQTYFNLDYDLSSLIGDDPHRLDDRGYGNSNVNVGNVSHGTLVSGIIGAIRDNHIGINGQAAFVKLMILRAVPEGDERDKDVGNAIRYAIENGANIINMSFGKNRSPQRDYVLSMMEYAAQNNVLLIHASGNDGVNTDLHPAYPRPNSEWSARNWIEVGASGPQRGESLCSRFSNVGTKSVNIFAPGESIYSTLPKNKYSAFKGTSLAAPQVAGIAALLWSQAPHLKATQIREMLLSSARTYPGLMVKIPTYPNGVLFSELSTSGGIVSAKGALQKIFQLP